MKSRSIIVVAIIFLIILFSGCQESKIVEVDIPYQNYTIIYGNLAADTAFNGITITKTLPLNVQYNIDAASINNAVAYLLLNHVNVIPLRYKEHGSYLTFNTIYPSAGEIYELFVEIEGKDYYAKSIIPEPPVAEMVRLEGDIITIDVLPRAGESYGATWVYLDNKMHVQAQADEIHSVVENRNNSTKLQVQTKPIPEEVSSTHEVTNLHVYLFAFDDDFANYFNSKSKNTSVENALTQGGSPIFSNISGENILGAFTASARSLLTLGPQNDR